MGKTALSNGALHTTQIYLKQTERLAQLLIEFGDDEDAQDYLNELEPIMRQTIRLLRVHSTTGPSLPRRQSFDPPNLKVSTPTRPKDAYVNLSEISKLTDFPSQQRKNSEASEMSTLKNLKRNKPRPAVMASKPAVMASKPAVMGTKPVVMAPKPAVIAPKPPLVAPKPKKLEVRAFIHQNLHINKLEIMNDKFITPTEMVENSIRRAGLSRMAPLRPNHELNHLENVRLRA